MVRLGKELDDRDSSDRNLVVETARQRLEHCDAFRGRSGLIKIEQENGTLVLHGRVPSYYLKQILQTTLRDIEGVDQIDNQVQVVWPDHS